VLDLPIPLQPDMRDRVLYVAPNGDDRNTGHYRTSPFATLGAAIAAAPAGDSVRILVAPGTYDEAVVIPAKQAGLVIIGLGGRGAVGLAPSAVNAVALTNHAADVTIVNLGLATNGTGKALANDGARLRMYGSKLEGGDPGAILALLTLYTVAQKAAVPRLIGGGADLLFDDCEFAWGDIGVKFLGTDYGAVTQPVFRRCRFHNLAAASFEEGIGAGGAAAQLYRNLELVDCVFETMEDGTAPTKWLSLDDDVANTGIVTGCRFPTAINSGNNLVSTGLHWIGNYHTGGIAAAQPS